MDLRQLAALTAVADHHSFSAAARALHTVQSNVSTHVARLENEVGIALVDRATGMLTEAGELVVTRARRVQYELDALGADVASSLGELSGAVRLGVIGTTGRWLVPQLLTEMAEVHPRVNLVVIDATTTSLVPQLASGGLDLAVVNLPVNDPDVDAEALFAEDHLILAPLSHPLAERDRVALAELVDIPLLLEPPGTGFRDDLDADAARAGIALTPQAEVDGMRLLASLAHQGHGAAILPASAIVDATEGSWRTVALDGTTPRAVGMATPRRARLSAPARAAAGLLAAVVAADVPHRRGLRLTPSGAPPSDRGGTIAGGRGAGDLR